uniref:DUF4780 domain-containing protein n=1 Tax=Streptomyces sp. IBSBF 2390 TaxID=2903533 RepID=UPI002FDC6DA3
GFNAGNGPKNLRFTPNIRVPVTNIDSKSFSDAVKSLLKVVVIDAAAPDLRMSVDNFSTVEWAVQRAMWKRILEGKKTVFLGSTMKERYRGFRVVNCEDVQMLNLVRETVAGLGELWPGCKLEVRHLHELPKCPAIKVNLPIPNMDDPQMVLGLLTVNNTEIPLS